MKSITVTEARIKIYDITDKVQKTGAQIMLTNKGKPKAILMSVEEYEGWLETLEIMSQNPSILKEIKKAEKEFKEGKTYSLDEVFGKDKI
jgi:prevent-host-death family protein